MGKKEYLGLADYAAYRGVTMPSVRHAIKTGKITSYEMEGRNYKIHVASADKEWDEARNYTHNKVAENVSSSDDETSGGKTNDLTKSKLLKAAYDAKLRKLEYEEKVGVLVKKDEVYKALFEMGKELRQEFQALADRVVDDVLAQRTRFDSHKVLSEAINKTLERLTEIETEKFKPCRNPKL